MMRKMGMMLAAGALAACSAQEQAASADAADTARAAAPAQASDSIIGPTAAVADSGTGTAIRIHPSLPPHRFALHGSEPGVVDSIVVSVEGNRVQTLRPRENQLPADAEMERVSSIDLDYDGYADLAFLNSVALANSRSEYWRFDPSTRRFVPVGELETLTPDSAAREHATFNRGGHGGRLWTAARLRWMDGRLMTIAEEEQMHEDGERYVHVVRRHRDGRMTETGREMLEGDDQLRAGPSWMEP